MNVLLLHAPTITAGITKQLAVNADEILRMEELEGGSTQIVQEDKGPTTVVDSLSDILKTLGSLGATVKEVAPPPAPEPPPEEVAMPKHGTPIGHAHTRAGVR